MDSVNVLSFVCPTDFTLIRFLVNLETLTIKTTSELVHINTIQNTIAKEVNLTSSTLFFIIKPDSLASVSKKAHISVSHC